MVKDRIELNADEFTTQKLLIGYFCIISFSCQGSIFNLCVCVCACVCVCVCVFLNPIFCFHYITSISITVNDTEIIFHILSCNICTYYIFFYSVLCQLLKTIFNSYIFFRFIFWVSSISIIEKLIH